MSGRRRTTRAEGRARSSRTSSRRAMQRAHLEEHPDTSPLERHSPNDAQNVEPGPRGRPSVRSRLPVEILDNIFRNLSQSELGTVLRVNSVFYTVSVRILYHTIGELKPRQCLACLRTLARNPKFSLLVRSFEIDWNKLSPIGNLYRLLHKVLKSLTFLVSLYLEMPRQHSPIWILDGCTFSLERFTTSIPCRRPLAQFLDRQTKVTELTLRGIQYDDVYFYPLISMAVAPHDGHVADENKFSLLPTSLPNLSQFRAIHAGPSVIASIVNGRPLQMVSIPLFPTLISDALTALELSSRPIKRLSLMSFDHAAHDFLLSDIARRFPYLEALHIVILLAEYSDELLKASGPLLAGFKSLQYLTFMAAANDTTPRSEEHTIAKLWHHWCPTLKTIILPTGKVWFEGDSEWICLDD